jgi:hypothetical protein
VNRERLQWVGVVSLLLIAGLTLGRLFAPPADDAQADPFRVQFWESRSLDLVAQVGLIFAGALGVAALLPRHEEGDR